MDQFDLIGKVIANVYGGVFYSFGTYSALACANCFIRRYNVAGRNVIIAAIDTTISEIDYNKCITVMWRILSRYELYNSIIKQELPLPIYEEIISVFLAPDNIPAEEFTKCI